MMSPTDRHPDATNTPQRTTSLNQARVARTASPAVRARPRAFVAAGGYERRVASLYCRSTSVGMRPRAGTPIPFAVAQARITLGSRLALVE